MRYTNGSITGCTIRIQAANLLVSRICWFQSRKHVPPYCARVFSCSFLESVALIHLKHWCTGHQKRPRKTPGGPSLPHSLVESEIVPKSRRRIHLQVLVGTFPATGAKIRKPRAPKQPKPAPAPAPTGLMAAAMSPAHAQIPNHGSGGTGIELNS